MFFTDRHECKFVVTEARAAEVLRRVRPHVEPDEHARHSADHAYEIASLYLDDAFDSLYHETVEGRRDRFKLRVRSYAGLERDVFLEVKRRHDRVVQKLRCPVPRALLGAVLTGAIGAEGLPSRSRELAEFLRLASHLSARPRCTVRYRRQAFVCFEDRETRVTFDRQIAALPTDDYVVAHRDERYVPVAAGGVVLELKFTNRCPAWMAQTIRELQLPRRSFSKYCHAIDAIAGTRAMGA